jgi:small subunit ribosomal protein S20
MPVLKSAIKKLRQDRKRRVLNLNLKETVKAALKLAKKSKTPEAIKKAQSLLDRAAKKHLFHKNKAARLKSNLMSAS